MGSMGSNGVDGPVRVRQREVPGSPHRPRWGLVRGQSCRWRCVSGMLARPQGKGGQTMKFALLLFDPEDYWESVSEEDMGTALAEHVAFAEELRGRGVVFSGEALKPAKEARSLRPSEQGPVAADGAFVALRQELAGFYLIECADMEE